MNNPNLILTPRRRALLAGHDNVLEVLVRVQAPMDVSADAPKRAPLHVALVIQPLAPLRARGPWQQAHVLVVAQRAHGQAGGVGQLTDAPAPRRGRSMLHQGGAYELTLRQIQGPTRRSTVATPDSFPGSQRRPTPFGFPSREAFHDLPPSQFPSREAFHDPPPSDFLPGKETQLLASDSWLSELRSQ